MTGCAFSIATVKKGSLFITGLFLACATFGWPHVGLAITGISDCGELQNMQNDLAGSYVLTGDIDCNGYSFTPVGYYTDPFIGTLDGDKHTISNLSVSQGLESGLFGQIDGGTVRDLYLYNIDSTGYQSVGTLAGEVVNGDISNIGVDTFLVTGETHAGGLVGNFVGGSLVRSYTTNGTVDVGRTLGGGLVGSVLDVHLSDLYSASSVIEQDPDSFYSADQVGGVFGRLAEDTGDVYVSNVYSDNEVSAVSMVGGIVGFYGASGSCSMSNTFFAGSVTAMGNDGSIVGYMSGGCDLVNAVHLSGDCIGGGGTSGAFSCSTAASEVSLYDSTTAPLSSWDFDTVWMETAGFPTFIWTDNTRPDPPADVTITTSSATATLEWTNDDAVDFNSVTIRRSTSGYPSTASGGTAVASGLTGTSFTDTGLTPETRYYYSLFTKNNFGIYSTPTYATDIVGRNACLLEAYWKFDETPATPADATGNGYNGVGTLVSLSEDTPTTGFVNPYSYTFSGSRINVSRPVQDDFTICAWVKTTAQGAGTGTEHYLSRAIAHAEAGGAANDFGFGMDADEHLTFGNGSITRDFGVHGTTTINTGAWTHVCATRQKANGAMKVYVNGEEDGAGTGSTTSLTANATMMIGLGSDSALPWKGSIDDVRVYAYALRLDEIADIANGVNACFGEATPRAIASQSSSSSLNDVERQGSGGGRGANGTKKIIETLQSRGSRASYSSRHSSVSSAPSASLPPLRSAAPKESISADMEERTCSRVFKWFANDDTMLGRVNTRLLKRFGFVCT